MSEDAVVFDPSKLGDIIIENIYIIYHRVDLDGVASAAILYNVQTELCKIFKTDRDIHLIPLDYPDLPWEDEEIKDGADVCIVDFSLPIPQMQSLAKRCKLIWIDHHITAIKAAEEADFDPEGIRRVGIGACQLVWEYTTDKACPETVKRLAEYDVWNHVHPDTLSIQYGLRCENWAMDPTEVAWRIVLDQIDNPRIVYETYEAIRANGLAVLSYIKQDGIEAMKQSFDITWGGLRCLALNRMSGSSTNSKTFDSKWDPKKYDAMMAFGLVEPGKWKVSLYTDKKDVDVGAFCKNYGGGGHKGAAGCTLSKLPWEK